jgi:hypothetical protein
MYTNKAYASARKKGYRSGLEVKLQEYFKEIGIDAKYESFKIDWEDIRYRKYTPDFLLPNGIIIETKGLFTAEDRRKHLLVKKQNPVLDIRFVFESSKRRISKVSKTTYGMWCEKHGFLYADKLVPEDWLREETK